MVISDHLNLLGDNPLRGENDERFWPALSGSDFGVRASSAGRVIEEAKAMGLEVPRGIYGALAGPSYETPAEIRMLRTLGADVVGMSTVPEAIVARHMNMQVVGISCITNLASGCLGRADRSQPGDGYRRASARKLYDPPESGCRETG